MGTAKEEEFNRHQEQATKAAASDAVASGKGFVCERCHEPLPRESWGLRTLCSYCDQIQSHLG